MGWLQLWDWCREYGPKAIAGLRSFVRIATYPSHARIKCDIEALDVGSTLLAHFLVAHSTATFDCWLNYLITIMTITSLFYQAPLSIVFGVFMTFDLCLAGSFGDLYPLTWQWLHLFSRCLAKMSRHLQYGMLTLNLVLPLSNQSEWEGI